MTDADVMPDAMPDRRTRGAEGLDRRAFTVDEVWRMIEARIIDPDEKFELIDGEIVPMNAAEGSPHLRLKIALNRYLVRHLDDAFNVAPDSTLYLSGYRRGRTFVEPDLYVFPAAIDLDDLDGAGVSLAIEISDSTLAYDLRRKPRIYARHGVPELWVIDVARMVTHVHRAPGETGYGAVHEVAASEMLTAALVPGLAFRLDAL